MDKHDFHATSVSSDHFLHHPLRSRLARCFRIPHSFNTPLNKHTTCAAHSRSPQLDWA